MTHMFRDCDALPPGQWITRGAIKVYELDQPPLMFQVGEWPTIELCEVCDSTHTRGERCPNCRGWAERAEELWSWERQRFANRHIVWDILDARKSVAA